MPTITPTVEMKKLANRIRKKKTCIRTGEEYTQLSLFEDKDSP